MAQRRMFSKEITNSSDFQMMSPSAQALYFHIGMNSDDDGFCEVFTIVRMTESKPDDLRALHERGLVYLVDSKVGIVKDWHTNNDIRSDRYTRSKYLDDPKYGDIYKTIMQEKVVHLSRYKNCLPVGITTGITKGITQDRLGKDRIDKVNTIRASKEPAEVTPKFSKEGAEIIDLFVKHVNPACGRYYNNKTQRTACEELLKIHGKERLESLISKTLPKTNKLAYMPTISTPLQLLEKYSALENAVHKLKDKQKAPNVIM